MNPVAHDQRPIEIWVEGGPMAGMLHDPVGDGPLAGLGVVVASGGLSRRVGLHRMYLLAARTLADYGATVLRFDRPGIGESEGALREVTPAGRASLDLESAAELGAAVDLLASQRRVEAIALLGHCSGGRRAILWAARDRRIQGVGTWAMPFRQDREAAPSPELAEAVRRVIERDLPGLWIYGTRDPALGEFNTFLESLSGPARDRTARRWTVCVVTDANHDFTSIAWTEQVIEATRDWMVILATSRRSRVSGR
ncbi:MAG TPA: alpha/beta fold hydrolase [Methylomirabilota bacterium]|nr:alpha/beta fold hydrolase [Methylomirabilota bacterium]